YGLPADQTDSEHQVPSQDSVHLMPPVNLSLTGSQNVGNSGCYDVQLQWELPYFEDTIAFGYGNKPYQVVSISHFDDNSLYVAMGWDTKLQPRKDLYVIGMEYFIGENALSIDGFVYLNNSLAYMFPQKEPIRANEWNTLMFDRYIPMDQPMELVIGYKVTFENAGAGTGIFIDEGPSDAFYGDLFSLDGREWYSLKIVGLDANLCINALVVNRPDSAASAAVTPDGPATAVVEAQKRLNFMNLTDTDTVEAGLSNRAVRLRGFNVYREDEKLNVDILKNFSYKDVALRMGEYEYVVEAVYGDGTAKSEGESIDLADIVSSIEAVPLAESVRVFPNPARLYFRVEGNYTSLEIMDLNGKTLRRYTDGRSEIDATGLTSGLYLLRFTSPDGMQRWQKIMLE
ncbi:MAG: T9SS type A sorting domain-containing protein, partial [Bacteroidales bacterium]|nr:T9SS type A sorting domain-containing protein [Bacteroidales bacterium]